WYSPRKTPLNCTMPALVKSRVGSSPGTSDEERTRVWPRRSKYARNASRISLPVIAALYHPDSTPLGPGCRPRRHCCPHRRGLGLSASSDIDGIAQPFLESWAQMEPESPRKSTPASTARRVRGPRVLDAPGARLVAADLLSRRAW